VIENASILVTGGTGSSGNAFVRTVPEQIRELIREHVDPAFAA